MRKKVQGVKKTNVNRWYIIQDVTSEVIQMVHPPETPKWYSNVVSLPKPMTTTAVSIGTGYIFSLPTRLSGIRFLDHR